jgi:hypothetical protein
MRGFAFAFGLSLLVSPALAAAHKPAAEPCKTRDEAIAALKTIAESANGSLVDIDAAGTKLMLPVWNSVPPTTHTVAEEILIVVAPPIDRSLIVFIHNGKACGGISMAGSALLTKMVAALPDKPKASETAPKPESHALPDPGHEPDLKL